MKNIAEIGLRDVQAVYGGAGRRAVGTGHGPADPHRRLPLVDGPGRAGRHRRRHVGRRSVLLHGAGMRFLVRFRNVARMHGVDATPAVVERAAAAARPKGWPKRSPSRWPTPARPACPRRSSTSSGARTPGATSSTRQADRRGRPPGETAAARSPSPIGSKGRQALTDAEAERFLRS